MTCLSISAALSLASTAESSFVLPNLAVYAAIAFVPILIIAATSYLKISVVLWILRSALGVAEIPPAAVITALSAVLTMFIMAPVAEEMVAAVESLSPSFAENGGDLGMEQARSLYAAASPPLSRFLKVNAPDNEVEFFSDLAGVERDDGGLRVLLPAFSTGELMEAIFMGVLILIPFLVIDLIVSMALVALGMHTLSPTVVSLPLKLLLFLAVDGWHIIVSGLAMSYGF